MVILSTFEELGPGMGFPSMRDFFCEMPYPGQDVILQYLKNGHVGACAPGFVIDAFTGENTRILLNIMDDGEYVWNSSLIYYVEKYNLRLPKEFEEKVLGK